MIFTLIIKPLRLCVLARDALSLLARSLPSLWWTTTNLVKTPSFQNIFVDYFLVVRGWINQIIN